MKALIKHAEFWSPTVLALLALLVALPREAFAVLPPGDSLDFRLDTLGADSLAGGVNLSDSPDFILDTTFSDAAAGLLLSDSPDFILNTTFADGVAGILSSDSADFILDTRAPDIGLGILLSDSADFTLDTTAPDVGLGILLADSGDFILDTRGTDTGLGGLLAADSPDFMLDTRDWLDIGLRVYDGIAAIKIAVEPPGSGGQLASTLRVSKGGTHYGIVLVPTDWPDASRIRVQTSTGPKAWRKMP